MSYVEIEIGTINRKLINLDQISQVALEITKPAVIIRYHEDIDSPLITIYDNEEEAKVAYQKIIDAIAHPSGFTSLAALFDNQGKHLFDIKRVTHWSVVEVAAVDPSENDPEGSPRAYWLTVKGQGYNQTLNFDDSRSLNQAAKTLETVYNNYHNSRQGIINPYADHTEES